MKRLYQYIDIPGKELRREGKGRDRSKFWNEGRWHNFIEPLIPEESLDFPFLEVGCNAGLYLKMAEDKGFRKVIGIDNDPDRIQQAKLYCEHNRGKYEIRHENIDSSYNWNQLPRFGLVLFSNTHYYLPVVDFAEVIASLRDRTLYCIIVGNKMGKTQGYVSPRLWRTKTYFGDWKEVKTIEKISIENDPSPRKGMYGILFKSPLETLDLEKWYSGGLNYETEEVRYKELLPVTVKFYRDLFSNNNLELKNTELYEYYLKTNRLSANNAYKYLTRKKELALDIEKNGIMKNVYVSDNTFEDGFSRCVIAYILGYKKIIIKKLKRPEKL